MALTLVEMLEEPFDASKYHDEYRVALLEMIEAKANGQEVVATPEAPLPKTVDLMAALKASLEAAKKAKPADAAAGRSGGQEPRASRRKWRSRSNDPIVGYGALDAVRGVPRQARLFQDRGAGAAERGAANGAAHVRRAEACRAAAALRLPPGGRWRAQVVADPERAVVQARRAPPGGDDRGPSARVRHIRGRHPQGRVRRRPGHRLGSRASTRPKRTASHASTASAPNALVRRGIEQGKLGLFLQGHKLHGGWTLVHTQDKNWLFIKKDDSFANADHDVAEGRPLGAVGPDDRGPEGRPTAATAAAADELTPSNRERRAQGRPAALAITHAAVACRAPVLQSQLAVRAQTGRLPRDRDRPESRGAPELAPWPGLLERVSVAGQRAAPAAIRGRHLRRRDRGARRRRGGPRFNSSRTARANRSRRCCTTPSTCCTATGTTCGA